MVELVVGLLNAGAGVQADDIGVMATYRKQVRRGRSTLRQCMNAVLAKGLPRSVLALQANCPIPRPTTPHNVCCSLTGPEDPAAAAPAWPGSHPGGHRRRLPGAGEPHMCTANFDEQGMPPCWLLTVLLAPAFDAPIPSAGGAHHLHFHGAQPPRVPAACPHNEKRWRRRRAGRRGRAPGLLVSGWNVCLASIRLCAYYGKLHRAWWPCSSTAPLGRCKGGGA